ncbi:hypothetical protein CHELA1G11_40143 [Hyphomicrobiales bacterium]|nr:hypothetical protein CHELA1G11_40143 [Hyphomicrobiales bacterium]
MNFPNPARFVSAPLAAASVMVLKTLSTMALACAFVSLCSVAILSAISAVVAIGALLGDVVCRICVYAPDRGATGIGRAHRDNVKARAGSALAGFGSCRRIGRALAPAAGERRVSRCRSKIRAMRLAALAEAVQSRSFVMASWSTPGSSTINP